MSIGCKVESAPVIDVEVEPKHPLDLRESDGSFDLSAQDEAFDGLLNQLEDAGLEEGLKMKAFKKVREAWMHAWSAATVADDDQAECRKVYDLAIFALETRRPFSWAIPTEQEVIAHQRKLDLASGE